MGGAGADKNRMFNVSSLLGDVTTKREHGTGNQSLGMNLQL